MAFNDSKNNDPSRTLEKRGKKKAEAEKIEYVPKCLKLFSEKKAFERYCAFLSYFFLFRVMRGLKNAFRVFQRSPCDGLGLGERIARNNDGWKSV